MRVEGFGAGEVPEEEYRGTALARKRTLLGPYRRPMPRFLRGC